MLRSLRWRLQAWYAVILLAVIVGFGATLHSVVRKGRFEEIDAELHAAARSLEGSLRTLPPRILREGFDFRQPGKEGKDRPFPPEERFLGKGRDPMREPMPDPSRRKPPPGAGEPTPGKAREPGPGGPGGFPRRPPDDRLEQSLALPPALQERYSAIETPLYFVVWRGNGNVLKGSPQGTDVPAPDASLVASDAPTMRQRAGLREVLLKGPEQTMIVVGHSVERELAAMGRFTWQLVFTGLGVFVVGLAGGWWLSRRAVRPIETMSGTAASITASNLSQRIDTADLDTELAQMGGVLNSMLQRLEQAFLQQVQFTADASHELRTPLSVVLSHTELALARQRSPEEYRATLETCLRAAQRMKSLVDELLTLARADAGRLELKRERVDLRQVAADGAALVAPLAAQRGVTVRVEGSPIQADADPQRLTQVVTNLLTNAVLYNRPGGEVTLAIAQENSSAVVTVADTGAGIAPDDLPLVFQRFYRADKARSRESGGSGLGLAICQSIVEAHGGTIDVSSQVNVGTTFSVRLPLAARASSP